MLGRRKGFPDTPMPPHSLPLTVIGASMLWVGWFGFNGGSQLAADGGAAMALTALFTGGGAPDTGWTFYVPYAVRTSTNVTLAVFGAFHFVRRIVPSPVVASAVLERGADAGITFTGSHNPPNYNGFKLSVGQSSIFGEDIQKMLDCPTDNLKPL